MLSSGGSVAPPGARLAKYFSQQPSPRIVWRLALVGPLLTATLALL
jgi:hypothetical protein